MTEQTEPTTRSGAIELFDPHTEWVNYGDLNPDMHGGLWVRYDPDYESFDVVETTHLANVNADLAESYDDPGEQYVAAYNVQMSDIFTESGGLTDTMLSILDQFQSPPETPLGIKHGRGLPYYVADFGFFRGVESKIVREDSYGDVIERYGVDPGESDNSQYD